MENKTARKSVTEYLKLVVWGAEKTTQEIIAERVFATATVRRGLKDLEASGRIYFKYDTNTWAWNRDMVAAAVAPVSSDRGAPWA